jgi:outer membrane protein assembly factor BamA
MNLSFSRIRRNQLFTPNQLDQSIDRLKLALAFDGYPCANVSGVANIDQGQFDLHVKAGERFTIKEIRETKIPGIHPAALHRYWAFDVGDQYRLLPFNLTSQRMTADGLVESSQFYPLCAESSEHSLPVEHIVVPGSPRIVRIGFGLSTEEYLIARAQWRSSRWGSSGSSVFADAKASFVEQRARVESHWYVWPHWPRFSVSPAIEVKREAEDKYSNLTSSAELVPRLSADHWAIRFDFQAGPQISDSRTLSGVGPRSAQFLSVIAGVRAISHEFEYFRADPKDGWRVEYNVKSVRKELYSPFSATRFSNGIHVLRSFGAFDQKYLLLGYRFAFHTTVRPRSQTADDIPPEFRHFLGGSRDLRGFSRRELPRDRAGALTSLFSSVELRSQVVFPERIQPLVFTDVGWLGNDQLELEPKAYASVGLGFRWQSPIGVIRGTLAHGLILGPGPSAGGQAEPHFHFSLGEEF